MSSPVDLELVSDPALPFELRLEIERVNSLYKQNQQGILALMMCGAIYIIVTRDINPPGFLVGWGSFLLTSAVLRAVAAARWLKFRGRIKSLDEVNVHLRIIHGLLFTSGILWGSIAWQIPFSHSIYKIVVTCIVAEWMAVGAVIAYSASFTALMLIFFPTFIPLTVAMLLSGDPSYRTIGIGLFVLVVIGVFSAKKFNKDALRLNRMTVENRILAEDLKSQVRIKTLALDASGAVTWRLNTSTGELFSDGNLLALPEVTHTAWRGSLDSYIEAVHPDDRNELRQTLDRALKSGEEFESDHRVVRKDGSIRFHSLRGRASADGMSGISWDITDKKAQEILRRERTEAEAANRAKSVLLANASHELRTPLAAINGFAELLMQEKNLSEEGKQETQIIVRNGRYMVSIVNDLLDLSRIESGQIYIQKSSTSVIDEIGDVVSLMRHEVEKKGLRLVVQYQSRVPEKIQSDAVRFREILINLLNNAVSFTERGTILLVVSFEKTEPSKGVLRIRISDTGIGISEEGVRNLFQPFSRGMEEVVQRKRGSGLGLALSKRLAALLGGDLRLVRTHVGIGSEFEFSVAVDPLGDVRLVYPDEVTRTAPARSISTAEDGKLRGRKILVVDDSPDLFTLLKRRLEKQGALVEIRQNGLEAVERAREKEFDLILMDIKMPVMDGYTAVQTLRRVGYARPIVALTAHASAEDRERSYQAGFDHYLSKPIDFQNLQQNLEKFV